MSTKPLVIAHRGFSGLYPENTVRSVSEAILIGSNIIEFDVQLTKDNEIVVFHDSTVERILKNDNGKKVADFTLSDLKKRDFGSWFDSKYADCKVATLEELLELKKNNSDFIFDYIIEIKSLNPEKLIPLVKEDLDKFNFKFSSGYLSVRNSDAFEIAKNASFSSDEIGLMQKRRAPEEIIKLGNDLQTKLIQIRPVGWSQNDWIGLKQSGLKFTIFYADSEEEFQKYIQLSPYGIFTNYPDKLLTFLNE